MSDKNQPTVKFNLSEYRKLFLILFNMINNSEADRYYIPPLNLAPVYIMAALAATVAVCSAALENKSSIPQPTAQSETLAHRPETSVYQLPSARARTETMAITKINHKIYSESRQVRGI